MENKTIKKFVSGVLGFAVQDWDRSFKEADEAGRLNAKVTNAIILELCKRMEIIENEKNPLD